jgi:hypothetical protein
MNTNHGLLANIILIGVGIICGSIFFIVEMNDLSLIFFSIALASILYQFLGGIGDTNSFNLGAIKFGGSAAILLGFMWFLKTIVFIPGEENKISINGPKWIPISTETGKTVQVSISNGKDTFVFPDSISKKERAAHGLDVLEDEDKKGTFRVNSLGEKGERIGYFELSNLKSSTLFNDIKIDPGEKRIKEFFLYPDSISKNSTEDYNNLALPFEVKVFNGSLFNILVDGEEFITNSEIVPKTSYLIPYKDDISYVVFLEQASSQINEKYKHRYSKWLVTKIKKNVLLDKN